MPTVPSGWKLRPSMKAWKFFVLFFLAIAVSFIAIEYFMSYYIINDVGLDSPLNTTRGFGYATDTGVTTVFYCLNLPIASRSIPTSLATSGFGFNFYPYTDNFSFVVNSLNLGSPRYYVSCPGTSEMPANAYFVLGLGFSTHDAAIISALNGTVTESMTVTMRVKFRTYFYSLQVTRSSSLDCNFGPIFDRSSPLTPCGKP